MGLYSYEAVTTEGKTRRGRLVGDSERAIRQQIKEKGWFTVDITLIGNESATKRRWWQLPVRRLPAKTTAVLLRLLAVMVEAGLTIENALATVGRQMDTDNGRKVLDRMRAVVVAGGSLSQAMREQTSAFPSYFAVIVESGERGGGLGAVLSRLADDIEGAERFRRRISVALIYPTIVTVVALAVVVVMLTYVVPQVSQIFVHMNQQLPLLTRIMMGLSAGLRANGDTMFLLFAVAFFCWLPLRRTAAVRLWSARMQLRLPLIGAVIRRADAVRVMRTLATLAAGKVVIADAAKITMRVCHNQVLAARVNEVGERIERGERLDRALDATGLFEPVIIQLVTVGLDSGRLSEMLDRAAQMQEEQMQNRIAVFMGLFEPMLILTMGVIVLLIVMAILVPIFELNQLVR